MVSNTAHPYDSVLFQREADRLDQGRELRYFRMPSCMHELDGGHAGCEQFDRVLLQ